MSDAKVLREAASLMRERADAAVIENDWKRGVAKLGRLTPKGQHMASWHPNVVLGVADLLDKEAEGIESGNWRPCADYAIAVAHAYLGESA